MDVMLRPAADLAPRLVRGLSRPPGSIRHPLPDGRETTVYVARFPRERTALRVVALGAPAPLGDWCAARAIPDALVGGFFVTGTPHPLGELWVGGERRPSVPFSAPWDAVRACLAVDGARVVVAPRHALPAVPSGDLLQAGPQLVADGCVVLRDGLDPEGFSAGREQFDSDITAGRHPRAALGVGAGEFIAVACDGRDDSEAGLTLRELAELMLGLGAREAINLDGGGSAALVTGGRLRNRPRAAWREALPGGRPSVTALVFAPIAAQGAPSTPS
jgi:Phosphodiester glycosidase